jgi:hypothetical protein
MPVHEKCEDPKCKTCVEEKEIDEAFKEGKDKNKITVNEEFVCDCDLKECEECNQRLKDKKLFELVNSKERDFTMELYELIFKENANSIPLPSSKIKDQIRQIFEESNIVEDRNYSDKEFLNDKVDLVFLFRLMKTPWEAKWLQYIIETEYDLCESDYCIFVDNCIQFDNFLMVEYFLTKIPKEISLLNYLEICYIYDPNNKELASKLISKCTKKEELEEFVYILAGFDNSSLLFDYIVKYSTNLKIDNNIISEEHIQTSVQKPLSFDIDDLDWKRINKIRSKMFLNPITSVQISTVLETVK